MNVFLLAIQEIKSTFEKYVLDLDLQLKEKEEEIRKLKEELQKSSEEGDIIII